MSGRTGWMSAINTARPARNALTRSRNWPRRPDLAVTKLTNTKTITGTTQPAAPAAPLAVAPAVRPAINPLARPPAASPRARPRVVSPQARPRPLPQAAGTRTAARATAPRLAMIAGTPTRGTPAAIITATIDEGQPRGSGATRTFEARPSGGKAAAGNSLTLARPTIDEARVL